jgi:nucleoside-diphosphate-sugar epimerase
MILITAATGQVGRAAALGLLESGVPVRVLVRDPAKAGGLERAELGSWPPEHRPGGPPTSPSSPTPMAPAILP